MYKSVDQKILKVGQLVQGALMLTEMVQIQIAKLKTF